MRSGPGAAGLALAAWIAAASPGLSAPESCTGPTVAQLPCLREVLAGAETGLRVVRDGVPGRVASRVGLSMADRDRLAAGLPKLVDLWVAYRDVECAPELVAVYSRRRGPDAEAASLLCRTNVTNVAAGDLNARLGTDPAARPRAAVDRPSPPPRSAASPSSEHGPDGSCADARPAEPCWGRIAKRAEAFRAEAWSAALTALGRRPGLSAGERRTLMAKVRDGERLWAEWRDAACSLEPLMPVGEAAAMPSADAVEACRARETFERTKTLRLMGRS